MIELFTDSLNTVDATLLRTILNHVACGVVLGEAIPDGHGAVTDFRLLTLNQAAERITGREASQVTGRSIRELVPEAYKTAIVDWAVSVLQTRTERQERLWIQSFAGGLTSCYNLIIRPAHQGVALTFVDVTRSEAEHDLLREVFDHAPLGLIVYEAIREPSADGKPGEIIDFRTIRYNERVSEYFGYSTADMENKTLLERFPAGQGFMPRYRALVENGEPFIDEYFFEKTGRWIENQARKLGDGYFSIVRDVTEQRQSAQALLAQQALFRTILHSVQVGINLFSPVYEESPDGKTRTLVDWRYDLVNSTVSAYIDQQPEALVGTRCSEWFPAYYANGNFESYRQAYETGQTLRFNQHYVGDGQDIWIDVLAQRVEDKLLVTLTDFTEARRAEEQLRAMLDASINSIIAMTAIRDDQGQIIDFTFDTVNKSVERSLGRQPEELVGQTLLGMYPGNVENGFFELYARATDTGIPQTGTLHYTDANGFEGWFEISAVQQSKDKVVITFMNVTETRQDQQQIEQMNALLKRSNESLDQFASVASHDLQEPLRKIKSFGDILLDQYGSSLGEGIGMLQRMQSAAGRMQTLIRDLLAYSRLSRIGEINHQPVDLSRLVSEVLVDLELAVQDKGATVETGPLPVLTGDALQLRQLFQNLLSNALKFTKPNRQPHIVIRGGRIGRTQLPPDVSLSGRAFWQITVADNGIGFNEEYRDKIFVAFERLHGKTSPYGGTGIGLAIVRKVMENHGGAVTGDGREGEGATFTLYFPASND